MRETPGTEEKLTLFNTMVFDLDGTLLNSLEDLWDSTNYALREMGFPERSLEEVRRFVGNGVGKLIERAVPAAASQEETEECLERFRVYYNDHMNDKTEPYPGIIPLLTELKEKGCQIGVVSNKYDRAVKQLCRHYFGDLIAVAVGERENVRKKPAPDGVLEAIRLLGSTPQRTIYVGDSNVDIETAKNANTVSIGVAWGFRGEKELEKASPDYLVTKPHQISSIFESGK